MTVAPTPPLTPAEVAELVSALAHWQAVADDARGKVDALKATIRDALPTGRHEYGGRVLTLTAGRRFNESKALALLDAAPEAVRRALIVETVERHVDRDRLRILDPATFEAAQDESTTRVALS